MDFNLSDHVNDDGTFVNPSALKALAGDEHKDTKCFDDIKDFQSFVKVHADTKSALGKRLENVIQKPGKDATDAEKAAYRASLKAELGAVKSGAEYEFKRPDLPAGMQYDEAMETQFREIFAKAGVPKEDAKGFYDAYNAGMLAKHKAAAEAETRQIGTEDEQLRKDWTGNDMLVNPRMAFAAMKSLGAEAFPKLWAGWTEPDGTVIKGLEVRLKEANIFDSPGDLAKWRACGVDPSMLRLYCVLGRKMIGANMLTGDGNAKPAAKGMTPTLQAEVDACNAQTKW
jgi:hypothetical protein